ncbi:MAG: hypothetical protein K8S27_08660 [Candidatus Omnitrophica bacterium]|nr:hypothetical protein [Candidatus Omnitrophota bacterium]
MPQYQYDYDQARRLTMITLPSGQQIENIYDDILLDEIHTPEGVIDFASYNNNQLQTVTMGTESIGYTYYGRLIKTETLSGTLSSNIVYDYNNDFALSGIMYAGSTSLFDYDDDGLLTLAGPFTVTPRAEDGLPGQVTDGVMDLTRSFNGYGETDNQTVTVNAQNVAQWGLTYYDTGLIETKIETVNGTTRNYHYTYDDFGRLREVRDNGTLIEEYRYTDPGTGTPVGIRTYEMNSRYPAGRTYQYDNEDRLQSAGGTTFVFDLDGSLQSKTESGNTITYSYSLHGELLSVTLPNNDVIEYVHDPLGRRVARKRNGTIEEKYLWRGQTQLLAVYDGSDILQMRFEYGEDRMPYLMVKNGSTYYLAYDHVGSLRAVTDANGQVVKEIEYNSFGNIINTPSAFTVPFGFAGGLYDSDTGLIRFGARDYDPDVGRWTAKDPIFFYGGDVDLYGYVFNNPVNWFDPNGLKTGLVCKAECEIACRPGPWLFKKICKKLCKKDCQEPLDCNIVFFKKGEKCYSCQQCPGQPDPVCEEIQCTAEVEKLCPKEKE